MSPPIELVTIESGQPPRAAEAGFVWGLLPDGRWYEKKKTKEKQQSKHKAKAASSSSSIHPTLEPKDGERVRRRHKKKPESPALQDPVHGHSPIGSISSPGRPLLESRSNTGEGERSGLYRRSMQFLRELRRYSASHSKVEPALSDTESTKSKTRELLENTSNLLRISIMQDGGFLARGSAPSTPTPSFESNSSYKRQNNNPPHQNSKAMSKSSSVLSLLMGKPPVTTPVDDAWYTASNQVDYFKVEISDPDGPTFLPSEAIRLSTPPLPSDRPRKGNLRGFFFDYGSPEGTPFIPSSNSSQTAAPGNISRADTLGSGEWLPFRFNPDMGMNQPFELNVPEHLLGSPLCPRSPLHPSGGKGICVYHGRTRTFSIPK